MPAGVIIEQPRRPIAGRAADDVTPRVIIERRHPVARRAADDVTPRVIVEHPRQCFGDGAPDHVAARRTVG
jgi:hypothetical protein